MPINQQYLANSICNCCRLLTNAIAMAYPQAAATQSLSKQSHDNICLIIHPPPQPIKTQLATAARLINILKTPTAPRALPNMHLNHCILQLSLIDWMQGPTRSIITPHICRLSLHKFWPTTELYKLSTHNNMSTTASVEEEGVVLKHDDDDVSCRTTMISPRMHVQCTDLSNLNTFSSLGLLTTLYTTQTLSDDIIVLPTYHLKPNENQRFYPSKAKLLQMKSSRVNSKGR